MIPDSFISALLDRVDIVDIISRQVKLKKTGSDWSGLCPFHSEKTPSFTVSATKQFYHCFGCGAHGTAIGFLMETMGYGFREAVEALAAPVGMVLPEDRGSAEDVEKKAVRAGLSAVVADAANYYRRQLKLSGSAIDYLKARGLTGRTAARFGLGYAPEGFHNLGAAFPAVAVDDFIRAGLMVPGERGQPYDRFRHRVLFPILDDRGQALGFGARSLDGAEPKYLNSPETPLFTKGRELYGLFQAKPFIAKAGCCWVTEGYFDVLSLTQAGIGHVVASLGTAVTEDQLRKLLRHTDRLYFCFDGDSAGRKAAVRLLPILAALSTDQRFFFFLFLPAGEDPDSFVRSRGREGFDGLKPTALPLSRFLLQHWVADHDFDLLEERAAMLSNAKSILSKMTQAPALRSSLVAELAEKTKLSSSQIEQLFDGKGRAGFARPIRPLQNDPAMSLADRMLSILLLRPAWRRKVGQRPRWLDLPGVDCELLAAAIETPSFDEEVDLVSVLTGRFTEASYRERLSRVAAFRRGCRLTEEELWAEWTDGIERLKSFWCRAELGRLKGLASERILTETECREMMNLMAVLKEASRRGEKQNRQ